jgi:hypothetical protein
MNTRFVMTLSGIALALTFIVGEQVLSADHPCDPDPNFPNACFDYGCSGMPPGTGDKHCEREHSGGNCECVDNELEG